MNSLNDFIPRYRLNEHFACPHFQTSLTTLDLAANRIAKLENVGHLTLLEEFWVCFAFENECKLKFHFIWKQICICIFNNRLVQEIKVKLRLFFESNFVWNINQYFHIIMGGWSYSAILLPTYPHCLYKYSVPVYM